MSDTEMSVFFGFLLFARIHYRSQKSHRQQWQKCFENHLVHIRFFKWL